MRVGWPKVEEEPKKEGSCPHALPFPSGEGLGTLRELSSTSAGSPIPEARWGCRTARGSPCSCSS